MSQGIRQPTADVSKVRECLLCGLGAVLGREMEADSRTQSPGELCQTRLQDTEYFITDQAALLILINSHPCAFVSSETGRHSHTNMQSQAQRRSCPHSKTTIYHITKHAFCSVRIFYASLEPEYIRTPKNMFLYILVAVVH